MVKKQQMAGVALVCCLFVGISLVQVGTSSRKPSVRRRLKFFDPRTTETKDGINLVPKFQVSSPIQSQQGSIQPQSQAVSQPDQGSLQSQLSFQTQPPLQQPQPGQPYTEDASNLKLCRELLKRKDSPLPPSQPFVVHESDQVCSSPESYAALSHMMLSSLIAQAGSKVRLIYQHNCVSQDLSRATIQQMLPPELSYGVGIGMQPIVDKCQKCVGEFESKGRHMLECMGFPNPGILPEPVDPMTTSFRMAGFRHNIHQAVQRRRQLEISSGQSPPSYGGAVIVLDLELEAWGKAWALPIYYYQQILPQDVPSIAILATQRCIDSQPMCQTHGQELANELQKLYPNAKIYGEILTSTSMAYVRVMDAPMLICPPTMFCILPSLFNEYSQKSYLIAKNNLYEWFKYVARENRKLMGKQINLTEDTEIKLRALDDSSGKLKMFLQRKPPEQQRMLI